jgi:hypothetical protein
MYTTARKWDSTTISRVNENHGQSMIDSKIKEERAKLDLKI